jgi:hypothetical protein
LSLIFISDNGKDFNPERKVKMVESVKRVEIRGLRWFDSVNGNTYFSAIGLVNNIEIVRIPFEYGYDNHYINEIAKSLEDKGFMPDRKHYSHGGREQAWSYFRDRNIEFVTSVKDVSSKKDLKNI